MSVFTGQSAWKALIKCNKLQEKKSVHYLELEHPQLATLSGSNTTTDLNLGQITFYTTHLSIIPILVLIANNIHIIESTVSSVVKPEVTRRGRRTKGHTEDSEEPAGEEEPLVGTLCCTLHKHDLVYPHQPPLQ